ncbi:HAD family hydrolase [Psittacicella hinzii]|uniref:Uncharacterized protein n=1 Tax=Psittacicella hinzii TaxID=2028575 RepID=A0A3A1YL27_9GAMM|nr:hypothetical protein [Psittacicella hinzii]RIY38993.1 hypothetical protein CKF58_03005 [Psittacicella hinzii]
MTLLDRSKSAIDAAEVVSFDIFDTLLIRPYVYPDHLFSHLEMLEDQLLGINTNFLYLRLSAESFARKKFKREVTLAEIYSYIHPQYQYMMEKEIALELQVLRANPEYKAVWDYCVAQGKRIVVISDMYLPHEVLEQALAKNGYANYEKLYVSSTYGVMKGTGELYKLVLKELAINPEQQLHFGDNKQADIEESSKLGIKNVYNPRVVDEFLQTHLQYQKLFSNEAGNLGVSISIALLAEKWNRDRFNGIQRDYWYNYGYFVGGAVAYGFSEWVYTYATSLGIEKLFLIARDCYTFRPIIESIGKLRGKVLQNDYIYIPRSIYHRFLMSDQE